jgi:hypothetical protein
MIHSARTLGAANESLCLEPTLHLPKIERLLKRAPVIGAAHLKRIQVARAGFEPARSCF